MVSPKTFFPVLSKKSTSLYGHSLGKGIQDSWTRFHEECQAAYIAPEKAATAAVSKNVSSLKEYGMANLGIQDVKKAEAFITSEFNKLNSDSVSIQIPRENCAPLAPDLFRVLKNVSPVVEGYYGSYFQPYWISIQQNKPGTTSSTSSFAWHIDDNPAQLMKIFVYFNDVAESNGAFRAFNYPTSHKLLEAGFKSWSKRLRVKSQKMIDDYFVAHPEELIVLDGKAGTVLMFDNNLVHKGTAPREGYRHVAQIEIYPSMTPLTEKQVNMALTRPLLRDYPADPRVNDLSGAQLV